MMLAKRGKGEIQMKKQKYTNSRGITLIALVVTIVVLLILASVSIGMLTGDNGIINQAKQGKEGAEISEEKEVIDISITQAMDADVMGDLEKNKLQEKLNLNTGNGVTEVIDSGDTLVVKFIEKNRYYEVNKDGNTEGPKELIKDNYAGDLSKGGTVDGSEERPFQINCIEDLVEFSMMTNGENTELGIASNNFSNKYVALMRTLDFKSIFSYNDYTTKKYGDLNTDGVIEDIKTELTKTTEGCVGFTIIGSFDGTFDGKENEIRNIYQYHNQDNTGDLGLFYRAKEIKNLSLTGTIINEKGHAAGICVYYCNKITNCKNYANITGYNMVGGINALNRIESSIIDNCINYGNIYITGQTYEYGGAGGIIGYSQTSTIENCKNFGDVNGVSTRAGIIGCTFQSNISNCMNSGKSLAGILGWSRTGEVNIINCYNVGECESGIVNLFKGGNWDSLPKLSIKNCYNLGKVSNAGIIGTQGTICKEITLNIENCYNAGESNKAIIGSISTSGSSTTITNVTNTYYDTSKCQNAGAHTDGVTALNESDMKNNETFIQTLNNNIGENVEWKHWEIGKDGYPIFI